MTRYALLLALLLCGPMAAIAAEVPSMTAPAPALNAVPPTTEEVVFNTRTLVKYRLRLPESLSAYTVTRVQALASDPTRFAVQVQFRAKTPFGGTTEHQAKFLMRRGVKAGIWIVTAE